MTICFNEIEIQNTISKIQTKVLDNNRTETSRDHVRPRKRKHDTNHICSTLKYNKEGKRYIQSRRLSPSQKAVIDKVFDYFTSIDNHLQKNDIKIDQLNPQDLHNNGIEAQLLLVTGQPGSGKSYVIETVTELCEKMKIGHVTTTSYNGMAAVNVDGNTICTTCSKC